MSYKDLLVHMTDDDACASRLAVAVALAVRHGAHLTGVYVEPPLPVSAYPEIPVPATVLEDALAAINARAQAQAMLFNTAIEQARVPGEWRQSRTDSVTTLNVNARYADLLIAGQRQARAGGWFDAATTEHVALASGRPLLVVPQTMRGTQLGTRIVIGWNGAREAVRAVHDALPLLVGAEFVQVMVINPQIGFGAHGAVPGADICAHLARHGVTVEAHIGIADPHLVGATLLQQATALGADLLVIGAYGHSRLRELVLGGATKHVLEHMTLPVLLAH